VEEPLFADPFLLVDEDAVHHGDLASRSAETQSGHATPGPEGFTQRDGLML
jgi:hypothetical protein